MDERTNERLTDLLQRTYGGEVLGVELFQELARREPDPARREKLRAAQLLEEQTRAVAAQLAADLDVEVHETEADRDAGRRAAEFLAGLEWTERMRAVGNATGNYRELYAELATVVPDPTHPCVTALIAHEQALNAFAIAEAGDDPTALNRLADALDDAHRGRLGG